MALIGEWMSFIERHSGLFILSMAGVLAILLVIGIIQLILATKMKRFYKKFASSDVSIDLPTVLSSLDEGIRDIENGLAEMESIVEGIGRQLQKSIDKVIIHKYDAFEYMNGQMSSVILLLDSRHTGAMINIIHGRDGSYTYTKRITEGKSETALSNEEKEALEAAMKTKEQP